MIGSFLLGIILLVIGLVLVWKSRFLYQNVGDLAEVLDISKGGWLLQWPILGSIVMLVGMLLMAGIISSRIFFFNSLSVPGL